jgi:hypothetical protein
MQYLKQSLIFLIEYGILGILTGIALVYVFDLNHKKLECEMILNPSPAVHIIT